MRSQCPAGKAEHQAGLAELVRCLQMSRMHVQVTQREDYCSDVPYFMPNEPLIYGCDHWMKHHLNVEGETCYHTGELVMCYIRETFAGATTSSGWK